ncbi:MAG: succinate dehydrogenase/fumarate reductase iron-sulfur subunit, partial [Bacteroidota bacterium]|nr:succinate dehydrogenase/fumarate reductase iron-sulfur subunit [Bacteroidota bacterium]
FGNCTNTGACEAECPKEIKILNIARMNKEYFVGKFVKDLQY